MYVNNGHFLTLKKVEEQLVNSASLKGEKKKGQESRNVGIADG